MDAASLGRTGLSVSVVGFGTARFAESFYDASRGEMIRLLRAAYDRGITYFDTSDMYSQGRSETLLGEAFAGGPSDVVICSKVGYVVTARAASVARLKSLAVPVLKRLRVPRPARGSGSSGGAGATPGQDFSPRAINAAVDGSLRRLRRSHLDLYLLHGLPEDGQVDDAFAALETLKALGKIRHYGASCELPEHAERALAVPELGVIQLSLSLLDGGAIDHLRTAHGRTIGAVARQCFASGTLARPSNSGSSERETPAVRALRAAAAANGRSLPELAFRYVRDSSLVDVTLVGVRLPRHLEDAIAFTQRPPLSARERAELEALGVPAI